MTAGSSPSLSLLSFSSLTRSVVSETHCWIALDRILYAACNCKRKTHIESEYVIHNTIGILDNHTHVMSLCMTVQRADVIVFHMRWQVRYLLIKVFALVSGTDFISK